MFYRSARLLPLSYSLQLRVIRNPEDRVLAVVAVLLCAVALPLVGSQYVLSSLLIPLLILSIAAMGLNILMGYAGQASLGSGAFMAVGAYTSFKLATTVPQIPVVCDFFLGGLLAALVGILFGLPSLRLRAFYLAIATLAAQFFIQWLFSKVPWFWTTSVRRGLHAGILGSGDSHRLRYQGYYLSLAIAGLTTWLAINLTRSHIGRQWMAVRDNEIAAQLMGISIVKAKLSAFAISSFYCGVAGALWGIVYLRTLGITSYSIDTSFMIMFMIVIGGIGTISGSFIGAAFVLLIPILLNVVPASLSLPISTGRHPAWNKSYLAG